MLFNRFINENILGFVLFHVFQNTAYLDVICRGAEESQLPEKYIAFLKSICHNGQDAHSDLCEKLFGDNCE